MVCDHAAQMIGFGFELPCVQDLGSVGEDDGQWFLHLSDVAYKLGDPSPNLDFELAWSSR